VQFHTPSPQLQVTGRVGWPLQSGAKPLEGQSRPGCAQRAPEFTSDGRGHPVATSGGEPASVSGVDPVSVPGCASPPLPPGSGKSAVRPPQAESKKSSPVARPKANARIGMTPAINPNASAMNGPFTFPTKAAGSRGAGVPNRANAVSRAAFAFGCARRSRRMDAAFLGGIDSRTPVLPRKAAIRASGQPTKPRDRNLGV
jgi:hypothetical protein